MASRTTRLQVPVVHGDDVEHRRIIAERANASLPKDGSQRATDPIPMQEYLVANLPSADLWNGGIVMVTDEAGGYTPAFSDGSNWLRMKDFSVVS